MRHVKWLSYSVLAAAISNGDISSGSTIGADAASAAAIRSFPYLYAVEGDLNASFPVVDHLAPKHRPDYNDSTAQSNDVEKPDFLFTDTGTYRIVEFYVHWCDICKAFRPHYIALGKRLLLLTASAAATATAEQNTTLDNTATTTSIMPTIEIHAVSCAPNRPLCKELAIDRYPYFRILVPGDDDALGVDIPHAQVNPATILNRMGIQVDESLLLGDDDLDEDLDTLSRSSETADAALSWWTRSVWLSSLLQWSGVVIPQPSSNTMIGKYSYKRSREELRDDVHASFDYALRQGVFMSNDPLPADRATILLDWLHLLRVTLPVSWTTLCKCVQELIDNFDYVQRSEDYMVALLDEFPPRRLLDSDDAGGIVVWSLACSHGQADAGYTCGLWQLFHVVTVGVVDYNRNVAFKEHRLATEAVARNIRQYIDAFFGCDTCRRNFIASFEACAHRRCERLMMEISDKESDWMELPLWLFEVHNAVNVRLQAERALREKRPKPITAADEGLVTWPPLRDCPACWSTAARKSAQGPDKTTAWNSTAVYMYLKIEYGQRDAVSVEYKQELSSYARNETQTDSLLESFSLQRWLPSSLWSVAASERWWPTWFIASTDDPETIHRGQRTFDELARDVHYVLDCMMRNGVYKDSNGDSTSLPPERRSVFKELLVLLDATLPMEWKTIHSMVRELLDNLSFVLASKDYLDAVLDDYPLENTANFPSCTSIESGGPRTTWDVFYVVAFGFNMLNDEGTAASLGVSVKSIAEGAVGTFKHFVDCPTCNAVLAESMAYCDFGVCGGRPPKSSRRTKVHGSQLVLWLATVQDAVLNRLSNASPAQTDAARWPPLDACAECWSQDEQLNYEETFRFLEKEYGFRGTTANEEL